jgi:hypothetical protein
VGEVVLQPSSSQIRRGDRIGFDEQSAKARQQTAELI